MTQLYLIALPQNRLLFLVPNDAHVLPRSQPVLKHDLGLVAHVQDAQSNLIRVL